METGSSKGVEIVFDPQAKKCVSIEINGKPLDYDRIYRVATIDYLANGGDYMEPLTKGKVVAQSDRIVYDDLIDYIKTFYRGRKSTPRLRSVCVPPADYGPSGYFFTNFKILLPGIATWILIVLALDFKKLFRCVLNP